MYPSIFNDVIGPIMRGPSSSHTAASVRIGRIAADLFGGMPQEVIMDFDRSGSLATTYDGQGSAIGLLGGFMGFELDDERLTDAEKYAKENGLTMQVRVLSYPNNHPNTYKMELRAKGKEPMFLTAISTGGGMIEFIEIDSTSISCKGDFYDYFFYTDSGIINHKYENEPDSNLLNNLFTSYNATKLRIAKPVLPILSRDNINVPFLTAKELIEYAEAHQYNYLWQAALDYESSRGGISKEQVFTMMENIVSKIKKSLHKGFKGTFYKDRILDSRIVNFNNFCKANKLLADSVMNSIISHTICMMEVKSSMGIIVAAPTAGSCAVLPGAIMGTAKALDLSDEHIIKAMLSAGIIGVLIQHASTFSAEVGGCQAECGSASGMAAAGLAEIAGGNINEALNAASIALQNTMGMVCDPVANRVEVPCMGKNIMAASNAFSCATMAMGGLSAVIPLDEVINAMDKVGKMLPYQLRCTGYGGLSVTPTAKNIEKKLKNKSRNRLNENK